MDSVKEIIYKPYFLYQARYSGASIVAYSLTIIQGIEPIATITTVVVVFLHLSFFSLLKYTYLNVLVRPFHACLMLS